MDETRILQTAIRPTRAEVDLGALRDNLRALRGHLGGPPPQVYAVVKADAYGHGAVQVATALERAGANGFAVSLVEEGIELRRALRAPVLVLGGWYGNAHGDVVAHDLTPIVFDPGDLERFSRAAGPRQVRLHLKVDTGMARLGVAMAQLDDFLARLKKFPNLELAGLCTHLACADDDDPSYTRDQLDKFAAARATVARAGFKPAVFHAANSSGTVRFPESRFDLVRPGIALLGDAASSAATLPGARPVMRLVTRILSIRELAEGQTVSYGGLWRAPRRSRIATLPLGYADGYPKRLTNTGQVLIGGQRVPIVGAVCMDMFMVDVTDVPAQAGDEVVLLGQQGEARISALDLAGWAGTINYEIYCGISKRVPRVYTNER